MGMEKEYTGTITLGAITPTYDLESEPTDFKSFENITETDMANATKSFMGEISQIPPAHSAIKINGQRVYKLARQGKEVKLEPRKVTISAFEITGIQLPKVHFRVICSTGTYIRSLANDFGAALGVGGYMSSLRRTRIGIFHVADAFSLPAFEEEIKQLTTLSEGHADT